MGRTFPTSVTAPVLLGTFIRSPGKVRPFPSRSTDFKHCSAWEHVLNDQNALALIENADFYKVGHHGSHNATPKPFVLTDWQGTGDAMVPWGLVEAWKDTIPKKELLDALTEKQHRVILPKEIRPGPGAPHAANDVVQTEWWSQLTFTVPE